LFAIVIHRTYLERVFCGVAVPCFSDSDKNFLRCNSTRRNEAAQSDQNVYDSGGRSSSLRPARRRM